MEAAAPFLIGVGAIVAAIIGLKVFFTLWRVVEKRLHPEKMDKPDNTPEVAFRGLKRKSVNVYMKNSDILRNHKYIKTLVFGDGEFATCTMVYFELESPEGNGVFVCGADITKLETIKDA